MRTTKLLQRILNYAITRRLKREQRNNKQKMIFFCMTWHGNIISHDRAFYRTCICHEIFQNKNHWLMYRSIPKPPMGGPRKTPGHLTFLKNFGQIPHYVPSLDGQMPHPLELQRGSNLPPSRENRIAYLWK